MSEDLGKSGRKSCFLICVSLLVLFGTILGFIAGLLVGGMLAKHGHFLNLNNREFGDGSSRGGLLGESNFHQCQNSGSKPGNQSFHSCSSSVCASAILLYVSGASYADCNGVYTLTNMTSVWDSKHIVYTRIYGGEDTNTEHRYIYWNSHFYGSNFYGWSIGDVKSLTESGPFHSQGRGGVANQPWLGSWNDNVTVSMISCDQASKVNIKMNNSRNNSNFPTSTSISNDRQFDNER